MSSESSCVDDEEEEEEEDEDEELPALGALPFLDLSSS